MTLDNAPPFSLDEAEASAATLVELGYSARAYPIVGDWGYCVVVTGRHGTGARFRYRIMHAAQVPKALDDLAAGLTGGSNTLEEGAG